MQSGTLDRFGFIDPTDGGESHRHSLSAEWSTSNGDRQLRARAYAIDYGLDLFSNFTYATDVDNGDQFEQFDDRMVYGGALSWSTPVQLGALSNELALGTDFRRDDIDTVGLATTTSRISTSPSSRAKRRPSKTSTFTRSSRAPCA